VAIEFDRDGNHSIGRRYLTGTGQTLDGVHEETLECQERGCVIHAPSAHCMQEFRTHWRDDRGLMERICPHGVGHPDPDHLMWVERTRGREARIVESVHGCCLDRCCIRKSQSL
jgi:hypothetical protein